MKPHLFLITFFILFHCLFSKAQTATLIKDIEIQRERPTISRNISEINGKIVLSLNDGIRGEELFIMNTPDDSPTLLKEINEGVGSSNPMGFSIANGLLFFHAESNNRRDLWITDGTEAGTKKIVIPSSTGYSPRALSPSENKLFFKETLSNNQEGIFVTDGTDEGTILLKTQYFDGGYTSPDQMLVFKGNLYFKNGSTTWTSDGTLQGTKALTPSLKIPQSSSAYYEFNGALYFSTFESGIETWHWDGTSAGTYKLNGLGSITSGFTSNDKLYFTSNDNTGEGIWTVDVQGQLSLVVRAYSLQILSGGDDFLLLKTTPYAGANPSLSGLNLASGQISSIANLTSNNLNYIPIYAKSLINGKSIVIGRNLGTGGDKIWLTDGTSLGTRLFPEFSNSNSFFFGESPKLLLGHYFLWNTSSLGNYELFAISETSNNIFSIPLSQLNASSSPGGFYRFQDKVLFMALQNLSYGLWSTQGGSQNTQLIRKAIAGSGSFSDPIEWNNKLYFTWADNYSDGELWQTDGTSNGTVLVKDIAPGTNGSYPKMKFIFNNKLYFFVTVNSKTQLWSTDGTGINTLYEMDLNEPYTGVYVHGNNFYFITSQAPLYKPSLYKSNGTPEGTILLKSFLTAGISSYSINRQFSALSNSICFMADDGISGSELWKMNLTDESVSLVKDINIGTGASNPQLGYITNNKLYFTAEDGSSGSELWISDGTEENTALLKEVIAGPDGIKLSGFIEFNGKVYSCVYDKNFISSVWMTDINTNNTQLFYQQANSSDGFPNNFFATHGKLFFSSNGVLKQSLGTPETISIVDLGVSFDKQYTPFNFFEFDDLALFQGYTADIGSELWALDFRTIEQQVNFSVTDKVYGDPDFEIIATSSSGLPVLLSSSNTAKLTFNDRTANIREAGNVTITGMQSGNSTIKSAFKEIAITIKKAPQTISFNLSSPARFSLGGKVNFTANASSGLPVKFESSNEAVLTISGNSGVLNGVGSSSIKAFQEDKNYETASVSKELIILKGLQEISIAEIEDQSANSPDILLTANSNVGLPIIYATNKKNVAIENNVLKILSAGSVTLSASQPGNEFYEAALTKEVSFCVIPLTPVISITNFTLQSNGIGDHEWFFENERLTEAKESIYTAVQSGNYKNRVSIDGCQSLFSNNVLVTIPDPVSSLEENFKGIFLFPNPTTDAISIQYSDTQQPISLTVYNTMGEIIKREIQVSNGYEFSMRDLPSGMYLFLISEGERFFFEKVIKK